MFSATALVILAFYSYSFAAFSIAAIIIYYLIRTLIFKMLWHTNEQQVIYLARQQSEIIESIRGISAIKLAKKEAIRRARLENATIESSRRAMDSQRIIQSFTGINIALFGFQRLFLMTYGGYLVISDQLTSGMLIASVAFADQFASKASSLIDKINEFRMLRLHLERISDIALEEPEERKIFINQRVECAPAISLKDVSFRYSESDPWILRKVSFEIAAGESVALIGRSGCGKTTLAKIILGLLPPNEGEVLISGSRNNGREDNYCISAVLQEDQLFAGTLAQNISFFDETATPERIYSAAKSAYIHNEIIQMPMGYESLVGDMGSALSGGQKQRILIARALYSNPQVIVLDEATSHLDTTAERATNETIKELKITRIIIAHRKETIEQADRVIDLDSLTTSQKECHAATAR